MKIINGMESNFYFVILGNLWTKPNFMFTIVSSIRFLQAKWKRIFKFEILKQLLSSVLKLTVISIFFFVFLHYFFYDFFSEEWDIVARNVCAELNWYLSLYGSIMSRARVHEDRDMERDYIEWQSAIDQTELRGIYRSSLCLFLLCVCFLTCSND